MPAPIHYRIRPTHPAAHLFTVECRVATPATDGQVFRLPAWIPGSYMIREFARHIVRIRAHSDGRDVALEKIDKASWRAAALPSGQSLSVEYEVYAWDLSVRAAHLDQTHGFFNGSSVFLAVEGQTDLPCELEILPPNDPACCDWAVATTLPALDEAWSFGRYRAADYAELIDHPVEMGGFTRIAFSAGGLPHEVVLSGRHDCDGPRLAADLASICAWQIALFGAPAPFERYLFLTQLVGDGYGGLEHRSSTALLAKRDDLPWAGMDTPTEGYKRFLGLCSHEYFHSWNVKRITPAAFTPYRLHEENYTRLLWAFEGFTSYYDDLTLVRAGVIAADDYLELLAQTISNVLRGSGRLKQSVAESSFDAWIKYYRQDENAPNAVVSYYAKGALIGLALDLQLRAQSAGERSLDDVMRLLWQRHGQTGIGVPEDGIVAAVRELGGAGLARWLQKAVNGTEDLPLDKLLRPFGVRLDLQPASKTPTLGIKLAGNGGECQIAQVFDDGPAQRAGLSAGDVLIACDGLRLNAKTLEALLSRRRAGETLHLHAFRRDELMEFELELADPPATQAKLTLQPRASAKARALRAGWLGQAAG